MAEDIEFQQGDLDGVMERFDHVNQWVSDFEEKYGLDRSTMASWIELRIRVI